MVKRLILAFAVAASAASAQQPAIFRIKPVRPVAELEKEALKASPPKETGDLLKTDLIDVAAMDSSIHLDVRYATTDNFLSMKVYASARAVAQRPAAQALLRAHHTLMKQGYGVLIHDAYRPGCGERFSGTRRRGQARVRRRSAEE